LERNKLPTNIFFALFAIPIPISIASWLGTIMSLASIGSIDWANANETIQAVVALIAMLAAGTYLVSYVIAFKATRKNGSRYWLSFLPVWHIIAIIVLMGLWSWANRALAA